MARKPKTTDIQVSVAKDDTKKLSTAQKQFNSLVKKIDSKKKLLREWQDTLPVYQQQHDSEYLPLVATINQHKWQFAVLLDQHYGNPLFKKTDKGKLKHLIVSVCESLFDGSDETEQLKTIFNRYSDDDYDTLLKNTHEDIEMVMKGFAKELFDIEVDHDVDLSSPEAFQAHIKEKLDQRQAQQAADAESVKPRKKTKRQLEKELRLQEEEALASKSIQEVYRKLVAVLHPDREPDEQERQRKTELMQKVNNAYDKKDLLKLLELQLEIEQIDLAHLGAIADTRLKHFNKILKEQPEKVDEESEEEEQYTEEEEALLERVSAIFRRNGKNPGRFFNRRRKPFKPNPNIICRGCGKKGHIERYCYSKKTNAIEGEEEEDELEEKVDSLSLEDYYQVNSVRRQHLN